MFLSYNEFDNICMFEPDPPWVCVPSENDAFLRDRFPLITKENICPYCHETTQASSLGVRGWPQRMEEFFKNVGVRFYGNGGETDLYQCPSCGWWMTFRFTTEGMVDEEKNYSSLIDLISANYAKLKRFDTAPLEKPLELLQKHLPKNTFPAFAPAPSKMVTFITQCFRQSFPCEVAYIGEAKSDNSHIFLIESDSPALLAVSKKAGVAAKLVREILWVEMNNNQPTAMWVSTADRFDDNDKALPVLIQNEFAVTGNLDAVLKILPKSDKPYAPWENPWKE